METKTDIKSIIVGLLFIIGINNLMAQQVYYSVQDGLWNDSTSWSTTGHDSINSLGTYPGINDRAIIKGHALLVEENVMVKSVSVNGGSLTEGRLALKNTTQMVVEEDLMLNELTANNKSELLISENSFLKINGNMRLQSLMNRRAAELRMTDSGKLVVAGKMELYYKGPADGVLVEMRDNTKIEIREDINLIHEGGREKIVLELRENATMRLHRNMLFETMLPERIYVHLKEQAIMRIGGNFERSRGNGNLLCDEMSNAEVIYEGTDPAQILAPNKVGNGMDEIIYRHVSVTKPLCRINIEDNVEVPGRFKMETKEIGLGNRELMLRNSYTNDFNYLMGKVKNSADGNFVRQTASTQPYLFPIGSTETEDVGYSGVLLYRGQNNLQIFKMGVEGDEGLRVSHNIGLHNNIEEEVRLEVQTRDDVVEFSYKIKPDGKIDPEIYVEMGGLEKELLDAGEYKISQKHNQLTILSVERIKLIFKKN